MEGTITNGSFTIEASYGTHTGCVRSLNEDYHICDLKMGIFLVADGMGGLSNGHVASKAAATTFVEVITRFIDDPDATLPFEINIDEDWLALLVQYAVDVANNEVINFSGGNGCKDKMGTTLTATIIMDDKIYVCHVGDSRLYRLRNEKLEQLTIDHSKVADMIRAGVLTEYEAKKHPKKNMITRCLGVRHKVNADVFTVEPEPGDIYLLCSDGLTNMVDDETLQVTITHPSNLETLCCDLIELAIDNGGRDNITALLLKFAQNQGYVSESQYEH